MKNGRVFRGRIHVDKSAVKTSKDPGFWIGTALMFNQASKDKGE